MAAVEHELEDPAARLPLGPATRQRALELLEDDGDDTRQLALLGLG